MEKVNNSDLENILILNNKFQNNESDGIAINDDYLQQKQILNFLFLKTNLSSHYILENIFDTCQMVDCDFSGGALNGSIFRDCLFTNCSFRKSELQNIDFNNCEFENCDFSRSQILNSKIDNTKFKNCNFRRFQLCNSFIRKTEFSVWTEEMALIKDNIEENVLRIK